MGDSECECVFVCVEVRRQAKLFLSPDCFFQGWNDICIFPGQGTSETRVLNLSVL